MIEKLGAQLYTVREFCKTPEDIRKTFHKVRDIGYKCVQCSGIGLIDPHELNEISMETSLPVVCTHIPYPRLVNELDKVIEEHKIYGCDYIGLGSMPPEYREDADSVRQFIKEFNKIGDKVSAAGLRLGYHNHSFEFIKLGGKRFFDMLIEETDPKKISFIIDTYWVQHGGGDVCDWLYGLKDRVFMLHLKDMGRNEEGPFITEVLEGNMNFEGIVKAAEEIGVEYYLVEQDTCPGDPFDSLKISFDNLRRELFAG